MLLAGNTPRIVGTWRRATPQMSGNVGQSDRTWLIRRPRDENDEVLSANDDSEGSFATFETQDSIFDEIVANPILPSRKTRLRQK